MLFDICFKSAFHTHPNDMTLIWLQYDCNMTLHTDKYYSKNLNLGPEEMPVDKKPVVSTVFNAIFTASVADAARICYLK